MTTSGLESRKYALTLVRAGDYLCPSNDGATLYRFSRYEDGRLAGLVCEFDLRDFWMVQSMPMPPQGALDLDEVWAWDTWHTVADSFPTRSAALAYVFGATT